MTTSLDRLKSCTLVVADTGDFNAMRTFLPQDATTNPSLILAASQLPQYAPLVADAIAYGRAFSDDALSPSALAAKRLERAVDKITVNFGAEILKIVPGRVSSEVDARLSFDAKRTVAKAHDIIALYESLGIGRDRILIKIASTWEGLQAARELEREGIHVNMTLLFCLEQASVAAEYGVTLISPFVGRITDYFKARDKVASYAPASDPGVVSVQRIYNHFKRNGYATVVMGASFRNKEQVLELAGCDLLTVAPNLLQELQETDGAAFEVKLSVERARADAAAVAADPKLSLDEATFRWRLNDNEMADFKLAEGIRRFASDLEKLEAILRPQLA